MDKEPRYLEWTSVINWKGYIHLHSDPIVKMQARCKGRKYPVAVVVGGNSKKNNVINRITIYILYKYI